MKSILSSLRNIYIFMRHKHTFIFIFLYSGVLLTWWWWQRLAVSWAWAGAGSTPAAPLARQCIYNTTQVKLCRNCYETHLSINQCFRIRIHRIQMFLGLPDPDPLVRGMDPDPALDPDPSFIQCCGSESGSVGSICFWAFWIRIWIF